MTNVNASVVEILPQAGADLQGFKLGYLPATAKAAQNDTITILNASQVKDASLRVGATGADEPYTLSANVITCTSATTGDIRGTVYYK